jgi:hypothetical protein
MFVSWILFPLLLTVLCAGCGLLLEWLTGRRLPGLLLAPAGLAMVVVLAAILTSRGETASLATPAVVCAALAGFFLAYWKGKRNWRQLRGSLDGWAIAAALAVFLVYGAPVVLSGDPTFTGYIKLDDTATWMTFVDQMMDNGRDLSGLDPSTYQTTLQVNLPNGYPVGAFLPLGVGAQLTGTDVAWLVQPFMATMAALLALCLYWIAAPLLASRPLRALVAFGASQSSLLFAYSLWGGVKEVAVAVAIALLAALAPGVAKTGIGWREAIPVAVAVTALLAMVGSGGLVWIGPILGLVALAFWRHSGLRALVRQAVPLVLLIAILGIPVLFAAGVFSPTQGGLTSDAELGNLIQPLSPFQYAGIWPNGDFRLDPANGPLTTFLIALAVLATLAGAVACWPRRAWLPLLYAVGAGVGSLAVFAYSSPWVGGKALASGSPSLLLLALAGAAAFAVRIERVLGATVLGLILAGVLWSNALGYHDVSLAPYAQLRELESIGEEIDGEGPTLMTEYQPYGVRHFLRAGDAEGASELRYRSVPLREGGELEKGDWGDTDQITLPALLTYRTLVLRRNPAQSRPPSVYSLIRSGDYYDVWQRAELSEGGDIVDHLPFGSFEDPAAEPDCDQVLALAAVAGPEGEVAAAERVPTTTSSLTGAPHPIAWTPTEPGSPDLIPRGPGSMELEVSVPLSDHYGFYLQGSVRNRLTVLVDGREVGSIVQQLNPAKQFLYFGSASLEQGPHIVTLDYEGQTLGPGSGGPPEPIGPLVLSSVRNEDPPVRKLPSSDARSLCGKHLDWVEALP